MDYPLIHGYIIYIAGRERAGKKYTNNIFILYKLYLIKNYFNLQKLNVQFLDELQKNYK